MIHDVDETIRRLLAGELSKGPDTLVSAPSQITFTGPGSSDAPSSGGATVNLYLHDVRENLALRDDSYAIVRRNADFSAGRKRAPIRLDLSYLITTHVNGDFAAEHRLLSDVLGVLLRNPAIPEQYQTGSLSAAGPNALPISVAQPDHVANADPATLWQALGGRLRPTLSLVVTATFDPFDTKWTRVVREAIVGLGQGVPPHGPQRPLDVTGVRVSAAGVVTDRQGRNAVEGVTVSAEGHQVRGITDDRGFFCLLNLPAGPHTLEFRKKGFQPQTVRVVAPPAGRSDSLEPVIVALEPLSDTDRAAEFVRNAGDSADALAVSEHGRVSRVSLSGTLRFADGRPAAYITVRTGDRMAITDADGVYCFYDLPVGEHQVLADVPGIGETAVTVGGAPGSPAIPAPPNDEPTRRTRTKKEG